MEHSLDTHTSAPDTPEEWRKVPLSTVADVRFSSVDKLAYPSEEPVRLCNYTDVYKNNYITAGLEFMRASATRKEIDRFGLRVGDVIITKDSETPYDIGIPAVVDHAEPDIVCGYHLGLIRPDTCLVDPTFLAKQLGHERIARYFARKANGLTRYGLPIDSVKGTPLWLPPTMEQQVIGHLFRLLDQVILQIQEIIAKQNLIRAGLLQDLLNRGLDENGEPRDQNSRPEPFKDSPIGPISNSWDALPLDKVASVDRGKFGHRPRNDPALYGGIFPFIQTGDIASAAREFIVEASQSLNPQGAAVSRQFPAGTIAITIAANIGDTAILGRPMFFPDSIVGVVPLSSHSSRWIEMCLRRAKTRLNALAPQSAQKNINLSFLKPLIIPVPHPSEQQRCSELYESVSSQILIQSNELEKLNAIKSGLMSDLLTGRVRVPQDLELE